MSLIARLTALAVLLVLTAMGLVWLRTDTFRAGNRLHDLGRQKREIEKTCCRLEVAIARLKSPNRLRPHAAALAAPANPFAPEPPCRLRREPLPRLVAGRAPEP